MYEIKDEENDTNGYIPLSHYIEHGSSFQQVVSHLNGDDEANGDDAVRNHQQSQQQFADDIKRFGLN